MIINGIDFGKRLDELKRQLHNRIEAKHLSIQSYTTREIRTLYYTLLLQQNSMIGMNNFEEFDRLKMLSSVCFDKLIAVTSVQMPHVKQKLIPLPIQLP